MGEFLKRPVPALNGFMEIENKRLQVLFIPAWYPSRLKPGEGVFIREHARAALLHNDVTVLYAYPAQSTNRRNICSVSDNDEDGIRTIRIEYGGTLSYLGKKLIRRKTVSAGTSTKTASSNRYLTPLLFFSSLFFNVCVYWHFRKLAKTGYKPDIIHAHVYPAGLISVLLGKLYRIPVVITEHSSAFPKHQLPFFEKVNVRYAFNRANSILPVSDYLRDHIESYGVHNRFDIVPNVVDTELFCPPAPEKNLTGPTKKLLFAGNIIPEKGVPQLLKALSLIRQSRQDFVLDIVGDGIYRNRYEELTCELGMDDAVTFHGFQPKEVVAEFMRNCDFFVLPSLQETFGTAYIEAMACGKPVIATDNGGPLSFVTEETGLLVPPGNVEKLVNAIRFMLDSGQKYSRKEIVTYIQDGFSYDAVGRKLDEIYHHIVR